MKDDISLHDNMSEDKSEDRALLLLQSHQRALRINTQATLALSVLFFVLVCVIWLESRRGYSTMIGLCVLFMVCNIPLFVKLLKHIAQEKEAIAYYKRKLQ